MVPRISNITNHIFAITMGVAMVFAATAMTLLYNNPSAATAQSV